MNARHYNVSVADMVDSASWCYSWEGRPRDAEQPTAETTWQDEDVDNSKTWFILQMTTTSHVTSHCMYTVTELKWTEISLQFSYV